MMDICLCKQQATYQRALYICQMEPVLLVYEAAGVIFKNCNGISIFYCMVLSCLGRI